jgi:hypothetical protein
MSLKKSVSKKSLNKKSEEDTESEYSDAEEKFNSISSEDINYVIKKIVSKEQLKSKIVFKKPPKSKNVSKELPKRNIIKKVTHIKPILKKKQKSNIEIDESSSNNEIEESSSNDDEIEESSNDDTIEESSSNDDTIEESSDDEKIEESYDGAIERKENVKYKLEIPTDDYYDNYIECYEEIDVDKLNHIIQNEEHFKKLINKMEEYKNKDLEQSFELAKKILNKSRGGKLKVTYRQRHKVKRYYADRSIGMQSLLRPIRQTIAKNYVDIDASNSGPSILKFICEKNKIAHPILTKYCDNRKEFIKRNGMTQIAGKKLCIIMLNSETEFKLNDTQKEFKKLNREIVDIQNELITKYNKNFKEFEKNMNESDCEDNKINIKGKFLSGIIYHVESQMLIQMYEFFKKQKSAVLCYDGIMLKNNNDVKYDDAKLRKCEAHILKNMGLKIILVIKPFDDKFNDSEFIKMKKYKEMSLGIYSDYKNLSGKNVELEHIQEYAKNVFLYSEQGGHGFFFTKNLEIDIKTKRSKIFYVSVSEEILLNNLNRNCNVINPRYDPKFKIDTTIGSKYDIRSKKYLYTNIGKKNGNSESFLSDCIKNMSNPDNDELKSSIRSYEKVEFYPYLKRLGVPDMQGCFNLFTGFPLDDEKIDDNSKYKNFNFEDSFFYNHLKLYICNNDKGELKHLLDTWADKIQNPAFARANAHLFYGLPGSGKSLIGIFLKNLIGIDYTVTYTNISRAFDRFNGISIHKLVKNFEEIGDKNGKFNKETFENADVLKGMITAETEFKEDKHKNSYATLHCALYNFFTNHESGLKIENGCRRYTLHKINGIMAKNKKYFKPIWAEIEDKNFMKMAFEYFATKVYEERDIQECYNTTYKKDQQIDIMPLGIKYLKYLIENDYMTPRPNSKILDKIILDDGWIDVNIFGKKFLEWVEVYSGKAISNKCSTSGLTTQLKRLNVISKSHRFTLSNKKKGNVVRSFKIDEETIGAKLKTYLEDQQFQFDKLDNNEDDDE